jgi:hypothetical protein
MPRSTDDPRNPRNQRFPGVEDLPAAPRTSLAVRLWRWRTETFLLGLAIGIVSAALVSAGAGNWWPSLVLAGAISAPAATRYGRGWVVAHAQCLLSRHRLQRVCLETTMHTRAGRIPLVLWITPTAAGEKALLATRAGICAEDFAAYSGEIAAACVARHVTVARHRAWANLVTVEIIRRDPLPGTISPGIERLYGRAAWLTLGSAHDVEEPPDIRHPLVLAAP